MPVDTYTPLHVTKTQHLRPMTWRRASVYFKLYHNTWYNQGCQFWLQNCFLLWYPAVIGWTIKVLRHIPPPMVITGYIVHDDLGKSRGEYVNALGQSKLVLIGRASICPLTTQCFICQTTFHHTAFTKYQQLCEYFWWSSNTIRYSENIFRCFAVYYAKTKYGFVLQVLKVSLQLI